VLLSPAPYNGNYDIGTIDIPMKIALKAIITAKLALMRQGISVRARKISNYNRVY
jgi:hypothetical protein